MGVAGATSDRGDDPGRRRRRPGRRRAEHGRRGVRLGQHPARLRAGAAGQGAARARARSPRRSSPSSPGIYVDKGLSEELALEVAQRAHRARRARRARGGRARHRPRRPHQPVDTRPGPRCSSFTRRRAAAAADDHAGRRRRPGLGHGRRGGRRARADRLGQRPARLRRRAGRAVVAQRRRRAASRCSSPTRSGPLVGTQIV